VFDPQHCTKSNNELPFWGDRHSMNMNGMVLTNISQSPYFTTQLQELKLHAQVCDEIYYNVRLFYLLGVVSCLHAAGHAFGTLGTRYTQSRRPNGHVRRRARSGFRRCSVVSLLSVVPSTSVACTTETIVHDDQPSTIAVHSWHGVFIYSVGVNCFCDDVWCAYADTRSRRKIYGAGTGHI
jgi:hypothetical protein